MKTKSKLLLSSSLMLAVTGVAMVGTTYAWFTASRTGNALTNEVTVVDTTSGLTITEDSNNAKKNLTDVSGTGLTATPTYYKANFDDAGAIVSNSYSVYAGSTIGSTEVVPYADFKFLITASGSISTVEQLDIQITDVTVTGTSKAISRVRLFSAASSYDAAYSADTSKLWAPVAETEGTYEYVSSDTATTAVTPDLIGETAFSSASPKVSLGTIQEIGNTGAVYFIARVWYEGTDADCITDNKSSVNGNLSIQFNITGVLENRPLAS